MFKRRKKMVESKAPEPPKPVEIEELQEPVTEEKEVEGELTEAQVIEFMQGVEAVMRNHQSRIAKIEHNLRLDFPE